MEFKGNSEPTSKQEQNTCAQLNPGGINKNVTVGKICSASVAFNLFKLSWDFSDILHNWA